MTDAAGAGGPRLAPGTIGGGATPGSAEGPPVMAPILRRTLAALGLGLLAAGPAAAQPAPPPIEPRAMEVVKASCATLAAARAMSFDALSTYEKFARNGQPLFFSVLNQVTMQRPDRLRVIKPGDGTPDEFYYDGKTMTAFVPSENLVAVAPAPPTIDAMLGAAWEKAAIFFPFADVIVSAPCALFDGHEINSAFYIGQSRVVAGTVTDMVALAGDRIQAQLWIGAEDKLPRLVRVTYPKEPARALYETAYSNWRITDAAEAGAFASARAAQGRPIEFAPPAGRAPPGVAPAPAPGPATTRPR